MHTLNCGSQTRTKTKQKKDIYAGAQQLLNNTSNNNTTNHYQLHNPVAEYANPMSLDNNNNNNNNNNGYEAPGDAFFPGADPRNSALDCDNAAAAAHCNFFV
jgi:hypothetical protein